MKLRTLQRWFGSLFHSAPFRSEPTYRPLLEVLENRVMLDSGLPATIVLGRTLSSYFVGSIQNNQETITFTVYNQQTNAVTGVLLTDTLEPGVTIVSASQLPDQSGQNLAWSLGTINGFDRVSVTLTVALPSPIPLQLDLGGQAFAALDAGMVTNTTPPVVLQTGTVDPSLLASTPDANTTDPFIQEEAAALSYNAQNIFNFLHTDIGYNSYFGSVRGARGTLWSSAGNALDVASLGVALMRASGIPAQYVQGTLSQVNAQILILTMFPASYQLTGYIPAGTQTANPESDAQLLAETESHYWFQFNTGSGFQNADPLMSASLGSTFASSQGTFTEVPDSLREKTEITLNAEIYSQANAAFGGTGITTTTVLNDTLNDVDLVGRPVTVGNNVTSTSVGLGFTTTTNTYSPYLELSDDAFPDPSQDEIIHGQSYQEILTDFPLGSQILTGLFLNFTMTGPQGPAQTYSKTLIDRLGFAARQNGGTVQIPPIDPSSPTIVNDLDLWTVNALPGLQSPEVLGGLYGTLSQLQVQLDATQNLVAQIPSSGPLNAQETEVLQQADALARDVTVIENENLSTVFALISDQTLANLEVGYLTRAYYTTPRLLVSSSSVDGNTGSFALDILKNDVRDEVQPGQSASMGFYMEIARGVEESITEGQAIADMTGQTPIGIAAVFAALPAQAPLVWIGPDNIQQLANFSISDTAKARITQEVGAGELVLTPTQMVVIDGQTTIGWFEVDPTTGHTISVMEDGGHQDALEYAAILVATGAYYGGLGYIIGSLQGFSLTTLEYVSDILSNTAIVPSSFANEDAFHVAVVAESFAQGMIEHELEAAEVLFPGGSIALNGATELVKGFIEGYDEGEQLAYQYFQILGLADPPVTPVLLAPVRINALDSGAACDVVIPSSGEPGSVSGAVGTPFVSLVGQESAIWSSTIASGMSVTSLVSSNSSVMTANGTPIGTGSLALQSYSDPQLLSITGGVTYALSGIGSLSFYGPAESDLGVSGNWGNYTAAVTGNVSITLTTDDLTLNGQTLPAGTYTITTNSAAISGSGDTTSPNFSGSASIIATDGTVDLGTGSGSVTVSGSSISPTNGVTLDGYTGTISVAAGGGNNTDSVTLSGSTGNVLTVSASPTTFTTDQNTPVTFHSNVQTNLADTYTITAQAPTGWMVSVDSSGNVAATPAAGLQSGTYPIRIIAQSKTDPDLVGQTTVNVTIRSSSRGITLNVAPDPLTTVPFNGAQLPTAFIASIHNSGPSAVTQNLAFSNIPSGFMLLESATSVTIPAGETGSVGVYLVPTSQIPTPGSQFSFNVSASDIFGDRAAETVSFTVSPVDAVTLVSSLSTVNATPGTTATDLVTITAVGNVPEYVTLSASVITGFTVAGLSNVSLQPGQSITENVALTPDPSTPLDTFLATTITAAYGPSNMPQTTTLQIPVDVVAPGALASVSAVASATQLGENDLAARLNDLTTELTNLVLSPTSAVARSQVLAAVNSVIGYLADDVYLSNLTPAITNDAATLAQAVTVADVDNSVTALGNDLDAIATTLADEIAHSVTVQLDPNQGQARPQEPVLYPIAIQNTGDQATTYDLSVSGLPPSVSASFNYSSVTLQPGQYLYGGPNGLTLTLIETAGELLPTSFTVTATAEGAPEINRSAAGSLTVRNAFVQVTVVTPSPSFTNTGGMVDVTARILNVTANPMTAQAFYTVTDPNGNIVFTSTPVSVPFSVFVSFPTVDLGSFNATGLAQGSYTISVLVTDAVGNPLTNVVGQGSLLIGTPVTASLSLSSTSSAFPYFPYAQSYTNTLTVNTQVSFPAPLTLDGVTATDAPESSIALDGTLAYVCGIQDVSIVDVSVPSSPQVVSSFGSNVITNGSSNICRVAGSLLLIASQIPVNATSFNLLIYSIADPLHPALLSNTQINYRFVEDMFVEGTTAYIPIGGVTYFAGVILTDQFGDLLAVDFSNPTSPRLEDVLFNDRGSPDGGDHVVSSGVAVNSQIAYAATTTSAGSNGQTGSGELLVVNTTDPSDLVVTGALVIPDTVHVIDVVIQGNQALVFGSTGGEIDIASGGLSSAGITGNLTVTPLDISDPEQPVISGPTLVTNNTFFTEGANLFAGDVSASSLGNGIYAVSDTQLNGNSEILLADANNPNDILVGETPTSSPVNEMTVAGGLLYVAGQDGISVYTIGQVLGVPVTVSVNIPTGTAVSYDPTSFNIAPSQILHETGFDTVSWALSLGAGSTSFTLTWTSNLAANQPAETLPVALGATVDFTSQETSGTLTLPGTNITVARYGFVFVSPADPTIQPGGTATYTITIERSTADTYNLSVVGLPASWVSLPTSITSPPNLEVSTSFTVQPDPTTPTGTYNFTVIATDGTITDSYQVSLTVQGQPILPPTDPDSHGVVAELTPTRASAGEGTSAAYVVQLTNTGSADDTFTVSAAGLPAGVTATFGQTAVDVPPGASNFRDVALTLTPAVGLALGSYSFTVTAASQTMPSVATVDSGTLNILASGVSVALNPPSGPPGTPFELTVTNTGQITDTFDLALAGPAALAAQLAATDVTLTPGTSQVVSISTGAVNFAVPGALGLTGYATSETDPTVQAGAVANLNIPTTTGMTAGFSPATQTISIPGPANFLLLVNNIGNTEDSYTASIVGTTGSLTASLTGLTGEATQAIPIFRLPGLATGAILLTANLGVIGQGTATVQVQSLSNGSIVANATATLIVNTQPPTANNQNLSTAENTSLAVTLSGADPNSPALPLTYDVITGPAHGTLTGTTPDLTYVPNGGYFGPDSYTFKTNNGYFDSNVATVSINVIAPPIANNSSVNIPENAPTAITLGATDPNTPALPLTYVIVTGPSHGSLNSVSGNTITYTPDTNYFGPDSFQFKVNNGTSDSNVATLSLNVLQANVTSVSALWGTKAALLQFASDGIRLLPAGRNTDLPWLNINAIAITLSHAATLNASDVSVSDIAGVNYGPVTVSGSGTNYTITLSNTVSRADRVTIALGNVQITAFSGRLDILPGDVNDDGVVNTTDGVLILNNFAPPHAYQAIYDFNGDGSVNMTDFTLYRPFIGTTLPSLPPQLAAGGEGPGGAARLTAFELAPVLTAAINDWIAARLPDLDIARLMAVTAVVTVLPAGYLGGAAIGGDTIYISADAAGYGWFIGSTPSSNATFGRRFAATELVASASTAAAGHEDLLTVVMHELGHVLGLNDLDPTEFPTDLMSETLATGVRRLPSREDVFDAVRTSVLPVQPAVPTNNALSNELLVAADPGGFLPVGSTKSFSSPPSQWLPLSVASTLSSPLLPVSDVFRTPGSPGLAGAPVEQSGAQDIWDIIASDLVGLTTSLVKRTPNSDKTAMKHSVTR